MQAGEIQTEHSIEDTNAIIPLDDASIKGATPTANAIEPADTTDPNADEQAPGGTELTAEQWATPPKENEIKELQSGWSADNKCIQCSEVKLCKFTLLSMTSDTAAIASSDCSSESRIDPAFLCEFECVHAYRDSNANADKPIALTLRKVPISMVADTTQTCSKCAECTICKYRLRPVPIATLDPAEATAEPADYQYICTDTCLSGLIALNHEKYTIRKKRAIIEELLSETTDKFRCIQCYETVACRFNFRQDDDEPLHICQEDCLNLLMKEQPDRFRIKRRSVRVRDLPKRAGHGSATAAPPADAEPVSAPDGGGKMLARTEAEAEVARRDRESSFVRRCAQCFSVVYVGDRSLVWETFDFCDEACLGQYQHVVGAACTMCQNSVTLTSLGKYCVRFGYEIRQFCRATCLDEFKKGLKVCSYCQKDISKNAEGFLASVAGQFKDFCTQTCYRRYDEMCNPSKKQVAGICAVCNTFDPVRVEILVDGKEHGFCSSPCFSAFKFVNNIVSGKFLVFSS